MVPFDWNMLYRISHVHNKKPLVVVEGSFFIFLLYKKVFCKYKRKIVTE